MISNKHADVRQIALKLPQIVCILTSFIFVMQINPFECGLFISEKDLCKNYKRQSLELFYFRANFIKNADVAYVLLWAQSTFLNNITMCCFHAIFLCL